MECFEVTVPDGARVAGCTAGGRPVAVPPGEYVVHVLRPQGSAPVLRFVGADPLGRDVHVPAAGQDVLASLLRRAEAAPQR